MVPEFDVVPILWNFLTVGVKRHKNTPPRNGSQQQEEPSEGSESRSPAGGLEAIHSSCDVHTRDRESEGDGWGRELKVKSRRVPNVCHPLHQRLAGRAQSSRRTSRASAFKTKLCVSVRRPSLGRATERREVDGRWESESRRERK